MPKEEKIAENTPPEDIDYVELVRFDADAERKFIEDNGEPAQITYYCRECEKIIRPKRIGKKFRFSCPDCKNDAAFGSKKSIANYFHIPESRLS
jgi:ribosomal protein L37AE/L43A